MADIMAFKKEVESYFGGSEVTSRRDDPRRRDQPTQKFLAYEMYTDPATLNRKLSGTSKQSLTGDEVRDIGSILIYWKRITRRKQLQRLFDLAGYTLPDNYWPEEPWKSLIDDTTPLKQPDLLPIQNASFEDWKDKVPVKWLCNTKTGEVKQVRGRENGYALEISGNRDNREWVYCRTRETQDIPVMLGSRVSLSFWAKKVQEGKNPERSKYVEVFFHDGFEWGWGFGQDVTNTGDWAHYETEWWAVPANVQKVSVGVVVYKDGAFQVDDVELRMRTDK